MNHQIPNQKSIKNSMYKYTIYLVIILYYIQVILLGYICSYVTVVMNLAI